ncbi:hypothetical protein B0H11DRAFT_2278953 [Mycena galericulata]|nr:hypothetical protein B0H11DRAFT_2278953 [Mycena galericulata]
MQHIKFSFPRGFVSSSARLNGRSQLRSRRRLASVGDTPVLSSDTNIPKIWGLPCREPSTPAERSQLISACFPTFRKELLPHRFSCDWHNSTGVRFFFIRQHWHNLSPADAVLTHAFNVSGPLRPLAFRDLGPSPHVLVAAGTEYYFWNGDEMTLTRYGAGFASDEDFLAQHSDPQCRYFDRRVVKEDFPADYDKIYCRLDAEQRLLAWKLEGRLDPDRSLLDPDAPRMLEV